MAPDRRRGRHVIFSHCGLLPPSSGTGQLMGFFRDVAGNRGRLVSH